MMKQLYSLVLLTVCCAVGHAQAPPSPSIISTNGGIAQNSMMILEWTIGEIAVESYRSGDKLYTEGFHQPVLVVAPVENPKVLTPGSGSQNIGAGTIRVMPNPVSTWLDLEFEFEKEMNIQLQLYDLKGQMVENEKLTVKKGSMKMDFSTFSHGLYILHITSEDGSFVRSCKIAKN